MQDHDKGLFSEQEFYDDHIVPLMLELQRACEAIGMPYLIAICFKHEHKNEKCYHGLGCFADVDAEKTPVGMILAAQMVEMPAPNAIMVAQFIQQMQEITEKINKEQGARFN